MRPSVILWPLVASSFLSVRAHAEISPTDRAAESRALVQRLVLDRAAAVAAVQRIADEREEQLFAELAAKDRRLRSEQRTRQEAQAKLAEVTGERQRLVDAIAARDRQFAAEIGEYRQQVASIADSSDPRKREALKRYAEGDRAGAFDALVAIQQAETKAVAAGWREIAALAQDRKDRGEMGTAEVIPLYETAQSMDPGFAWGWIKLRWLYQEAGRLPDARRAAEQARMHAQNDWDRATAEIGLGSVLLKSGDLAGAGARFEESLKIRERLAVENPGNADAQLNLSISLDNLGIVLVAAGDLAGGRARLEASLGIRERLAASSPGSLAAQHNLNASLEKLGHVLVLSGDLAGARARFEESLRIAKRLAASSPGSAAVQRVLGSGLSRLGDVLAASGDLAGARARFEECLEIDERLAAANPSNAEAQRDLSVDLNKLGAVLVQSGDLAAARARFEASFKIRQRLVAADPSSAEAQRDVCVSLNHLGDMSAASRDPAGARARFEECLAIAERLAAADPKNAEYQLDLAVSHAKLGDLPGGEPHWSEALRIALDLQSQGRLAPSDAWMIDDLRMRIAAAKKVEP